MSVDDFAKIAPFHQQAEDVGSYLRQVQTRRDDSASNRDQERIMSVDELVKIAPFHQQAEDVGSYLRQDQTRRDSAERPFELRPCPSEKAD